MFFLQDLNVRVQQGKCVYAIAALQAAEFEPPAINLIKRETFPAG